MADLKTGIFRRCLPSWRAKIANCSAAATENNQNAHSDSPVQRITGVNFLVGAIALRRFHRRAYRGLSSGPTHAPPMAVEKRIRPKVFYAHVFERKALRPRLLLAFSLVHSHSRHVLKTCFWRPCTTHDCATLNFMKRSNQLRSSRLLSQSGLSY